MLDEIHRDKLVESPKLQETTASKLTLVVPVGRCAWLACSCLAQCAYVVGDKETYFKRNCCT